MKRKRIIIFGALAVLAVAYILSIIPNFRHRSEWNQAVRALRGFPRERVYSAVEAFVRAQELQGRSVSNTVPLRELVAGGFLRSEEAARFSGVDLAFSVVVDETRPQQIVARVPLRSGSVAVQLADGSIQQVTRAALERQERK